MKKNVYVSGQFLTQLATGLYFTLSGLLGIMGYNSGANQLVNDFNKLMGKNSYLPVIISILFLLVGLGLIVGVFVAIKNKSVYFIAFVLWIIYIVMTLFTDNFLEPELLPWLKELSLQLLILAGLWKITQK